jgi:hypothetical protein
VSIRHPAPDETVLTSYWCFSSSGFRDVVTLPTAGTYRIVIDPYNNYTGSLTFTLYNVPADPTGSVTVNGSPAPVTIATPGQNANVTFSGTLNQSVRVPVTRPGSGTCAAITLLRQDNVTAVATYWNCGTTITLPPTSLPATETYHIVLDPMDAAIGSFTVSVSSP